MFPSRTQWHAWTALEKITYVAQIFATLSLLPTVAFSWLAWRETRLAREDQAKYFFSEKAPRIVASEFQISNNTLSIELKNYGESTANVVYAVTYVIRPDRTTDYISPNPPGVIGTMMKGEARRIDLFEMTHVERALGFSPKKFEEARPPKVGEKSARLHVEVRFNDANNTENRRYQWFTASE